MSRRSAKNKKLEGVPRFLCFLFNTYIYKYQIGTQSGRYFFFFLKVLERKKYLYIYIYTHVIKKKKKKKNNLFRFGTEADFSRSRERAYTLTPPGRRGARPANEGLCPRNNTCERMRYALTQAAADFVRFAGLLCVGWYKLPG